MVPDKKLKPSTNKKLCPTPGKGQPGGVHSVSHGFRPGLTGELEKCQSVERRGRSPWQEGRDSSRENGETGSTVVYVAGRYEKCCMKYCNMIYIYDI